MNDKNIENAKNGYNKITAPDDLKERILQQQTQKKRASVILRMRPFISAAACLLIVLTCVFLIKNNGGRQNGIYLADGTQVTTEAQAVDGVCLETTDMGTGTCAYVQRDIASNAVALDLEEDGEIIVTVSKGTLYTVDRGSTVLLAKTPASFPGKTTIYWQFELFGEEEFDATMNVVAAEKAYKVLLHYGNNRFTVLISE